MFLFEYPPSGEQSSWTCRSAIEESLKRAVDQLTIEDSIAIADHWTCQHPDEIHYLHGIDFVAKLAQIAKEAPTPGRIHEFGYWEIPYNDKQKPRLFFFGVLGGARQLIERICNRQGISPPPLSAYAEVL